MDMESNDDSSSVESRVTLTQEDEACIRCLGYIIYFDIVGRGTGCGKFAQQVEKLAATYDRTISRFNKNDTILYFFFHFAHNFGDFMIIDREKNVCTGEVFDINDIEDENFTFKISFIKFRVTNKFNSEDSKLFFINVFDFGWERIAVHVCYLGDEILDQKTAILCIFEDPLKIDQSERIPFLKKLFSQFYATFCRNFFNRVLFGLPFHSPEYSYSSDSVEI